MPTASGRPEAARGVDEAAVLEFAQAFRAAARAAAFYPTAHPAVVSCLDQVTRAATVLAAAGSLCLTILPGALLVGGVPFDNPDRAVADLANILHRHGVGALSLSGRVKPDAWAALFGLLARSPDEVRAAGGIQRQWREFRHSNPRILEIDFGELLRGRIGGDAHELAGLISHYLELGGIEAAIADDVRASIERIRQNAAGDREAVDAILKELRGLVFLTRVAPPERADDMLRQAAGAGAHLSEGVMAGLLARRGTPEALIGSTDVVDAFVSRMTDRTVAEFLMNAVRGSGGSAPQLTDVFAGLVPDLVRRRRIVIDVQRGLNQGGSAFEPDVLARWEHLERRLEAHSDRRFVSDQYARELHAARPRGAAAVRSLEDPPERIAAWVQSIDDGSIDDLDRRLLDDLARLETDPHQWLLVLGILRAHVVEAADGGDWSGAAQAAEAIAREASSDTADGTRRRLARQTLEELSRSPTSSRALHAVAMPAPREGDAVARLLRAIGPALVPAIVGRHREESREGVRAVLEHLVVACGRAGTDAVKQLLGAAAPETRAAAIRLLCRISVGGHLSLLEDLLADPSDRVCREALQALATAPSDLARETLARGIARGDESRQLAILDQVEALEPEQALPVLHCLLRALDQKTAPRAVYLSIINRLGRARTDDAVAALAVVFEKTAWSAPWRAMPFRSAAVNALRAIDSPAARAALGQASIFGRRGPRGGTDQGSGGTIVSNGRADR